MTRTAAIYDWNSLSWQYKSETNVGNPLFQTDLLSKLFDLSGGGGRSKRIEIRRRGVCLENSTGAWQQKIEERNTSLRPETSTTRYEQQQGQKRSGFEEFTLGTHLSGSINRLMRIAIPFVQVCRETWIGRLFISCNRPLKGSNYII